MRINVAIVDDDFSALTAIKNYCEKIDLNVVGAFNSSAKFINDIDSLKFDIAILDYFMPQFNGIQLAEVLNSKNIPVIFITGHREEIASKAWDLNCIACIEKPVNVEKMRMAISKYKPNFVTDGFIELEIYGGKIAKIKIDEIAHIGQCKADSSGNDRILTDLSGNEYRVVNKKMENFITLLPPNKFMRVGKSDIVGRHAIFTYAKNYEEITLSVKEKKVPISPSRKNEFIEWYNG